MPHPRHSLATPLPLPRFYLTTPSPLPLTTPSHHSLSPIPSCFPSAAGVAIEAKLQQDIVLTILDSNSSADAVLKEDMWSR